MSKEHRGRIQAQGDGVEKSVSWAQDEPITKKEGLTLLRRLRSLLSRKDQLNREKQFRDAERYIEQVNGGIDAVKKKTFRNRKTKDTRVDIEILGGKAFISVLLILAILSYFLLN